MNGDDGANGMAKNFDTNLEDGDEDEDDHYKADDDNEAWDDSQLRRWLWFQFVALLHETTPKESTTESKQLLIALDIHVLYLDGY